MDHVTPLCMWQDLDVIAPSSPRTLSPLCSSSQRCLLCWPHSRHPPASGPSHLLFPLPAPFLSQMYSHFLPLHQILLSLRPIPTTRYKTPLSHFLLPVTCFLTLHNTFTRHCHICLILSPSSGMFTPPGQRHGPFHSCLYPALRTVPGIK